MSHIKTLVLTSGFAPLCFLIAGCATNTPPSVAPSAPLEGKYEPRPANEAVMRLYFKADGTLIRAEGLAGGNWEKEVALPEKPDKTLGAKVADIEVWEHNGNLLDLKIEDGSLHGKSAHDHDSGLVNPPWNSHCHRYVQIGGQWVLVHCN